MNHPIPKKSLVQKIHNAFSDTWKCKYCGDVTRDPEGRPNPLVSIFWAGLLVILGVGAIFDFFAFIRGFILVVILFIIQANSYGRVHRWRCPSCRRRELIPASSVAARQAAPAEVPPAGPAPAAVAEEAVPDPGEDVDRAVRRMEGSERVRLQVVRKKRPVRIRLPSRDGPDVGAE